MEESVDMTELARCLAEAAKDLPEPFEDLTKALGLREVSTEELATVLGLTDRRIAQLWQAGIIPEPRREGKRYLFPLLASVNGYIGFLRER